MVFYFLRTNNEDTMKRYTHFTTRLVLLFSCFFLLSELQQTFATTISSTNGEQIVDSSTQISFVTCGSGQEIYSLYGHTAIHIKDSSNGLDVAVNYGVFSFRKPYFVLHFIFGLTDYKMGIVPYSIFCQEYKNEERWICEQRLNLNMDEKIAIINAIAENYRPENREYRYNYFYDNCTTRARDMIEDHLNDKKIIYSDKDTQCETYRQLIHKCCIAHPWARFGNDMLLGLQADFNISSRERQFLPIVMMHDLDGARIHGKALVCDKKMVVEPNYQPQNNTFPLTPRVCALLFLAVIVILSIIECATKKLFRWLDAILMTMCGLAGIILTLMLFSQHPTVRINLQLLLLNPLPLFFVYPMLRGRMSWQYRMWILLICLFFLGAALQTYAEGMLIVASSLLIRNVRHLLHERKVSTNKRE